MAAAEYYNTSGAQTAPHQSSPYNNSPYNHSPYQQSPHQRPHELHGSPVPQSSVHLGSPYPQQAPPPPYYPPTQPQQYQQQDHKPSVHFSPALTPPRRNSGPGSGPNSHRPSVSSQSPQNHGQYLQPPPSHGAPPPAVAVQPPHMRPYMNGNQSEYSLGYSSDPEEARRRRRHRRHSHNRRDEEESSREVRPQGNRSRSTNTDGFLGAAGGGLIGDLIFPGLGTVGGAVAGWLGGKDYGKHRKHKEEKLHREQKDWEHKFRDRSNSDERRHRHGHHHERHHDHDRSPRRRDDN